MKGDEQERRGTGDADKNRKGSKDWKWIENMQKIRTKQKGSGRTERKGKM